MDFRKKLKIRLYIAVSYIVVGIILILIDLIFHTENEFISMFGITLSLCGIVRIRNNYIITKNDDTIRKREIMETDERNLAISQKARSIAFYIYVVAACIAVVVFQFLNKTELASLLGFSVCFLVFIYWIAYYIISKKS